MHSNSGEKKQKEKGPGFLRGLLSTVYGISKIMPLEYYGLLKVVPPDAPGFPQPGGRFWKCSGVKADRSIEHTVVHKVDRIEHDPFCIYRIMDKCARLVTNEFAVLVGAIGVVRHGN